MPATGSAPVGPTEGTGAASVDAGSSRKEHAMQYALLIYRKPDDDEGLDEETRRAVSVEYLALRDDPRVLGGEALYPVEVATTVRLDGGQLLITDGPFADPKEVFGGWYLAEAADLDDALDLAGRIPALRLGGSVEVRPVVERLP